MLIELMFICVNLKKFVGEGFNALPQKSIIGGQAQRPAPTVLFKYLSKLNINLFFSCFFICIVLLLLWFKGVADVFYVAICVNTVSDIIYRLLAFALNGKTFTVESTVEVFFYSLHKIYLRKVVKNGFY